MAEPLAPARPRKPASDHTMTVWVRLSSGEGQLLVTIARRHGLLADEMARRMLVDAILIAQNGGGS